MKRSGDVGLVVMGAAGFAATFAGGLAYSAWQKPSQAVGTQSAQNCAQDSDGAQNCQPERRSMAYYFYPRFVHGWSWGGSSLAEPTTRSAALSGNSRSYAPADGTTVRGGFGSTASSASYRVSAGG